MTKNTEKQSNSTFASIEIPQGLSKANFFFLFFNTLLISILITMTAILQPAFLKDIININQNYAGSINSFLQIMGQIATLTLVAYTCALSDRTGRKKLAFFGFVVLAVSFYLLWLSNGIAYFLHVPAGMASKVCALLSFAPSETAEFADFAPGLFITYLIRLTIGIAMVFIFPQFITMVADYTYEDDRGKGMAANGLMMGIASMIVFLVIAPIQKSTGVETSFYIAVVVSLAGALCTVAFLKDRVSETSQGKNGLKYIYPIVRKNLALKVSYICALITRADIVVLSTFLVTWGVKVADAHQMSAVQATAKASIPLAIMGGVSLVAFPIIGILLDKWGRVPTIILCLPLDAAALLILAVSPDPFSFRVCAAMVPFAFGMAGAIAGANTLASDASPKESVGAIFGGLNTMQPVGIFIFMLGGGFVFDKLSPGWAFGIKGIATLVLSFWVITVKDQIRTSTKECKTKVPLLCKPSTQLRRKEY